MSEIQIHLVPPTELSQPFWDAAGEKRLLVQWCPACDRGIFYPREACPSCLGTTLEWRESAGTGVVYACTRAHHEALTSVIGQPPFLTALVDLDDGVRMPTVLVDVDVDDVVEAIGRPVRVRWTDVNRRTYPVFGPA